MVKRILGKTETRRDPSVIPRSLSDELLRLIWRERCISRAEIARQTGLARSTVSEIVGGLLETGLVAEAGTGKSRGGRRPILLEFQDNACQILGVDIGAAHVAVALTDLRGRVLTWHESQHPVRTDPEGTRELVKKLCTESLASTDGKKRLIGIGVAMPSPVDPLHSELLSERVLPEWRGTSGLENLKKKFNVNVLIDNDANLGALAERWWGAGRNTDNFIYIKVATGIGAGLILGGEIYRGSTGVAGEIGHIPVDPEGKLCVCGLKGCLVTFAGAYALEDRARELLSSDHSDSILAGKDPNITAIEDAALAGDRLALQLVEEATGNLGIVVAGLLNLMNPGMIVIGGSLARLGDLILEPLRRTCNQLTLSDSAAAALLKTSDLGPQTEAIGASTLVLKTALDNPSDYFGVYAPEE